MDFKHEGMAEWDQRQAFHERLHEAILFCHRSMFKNDYEGWFKGLTVLELELSAHLRTSEEQELIKGNMQKVRTTLNNNYTNKFFIFLEAQKSMHKIMRLRSFDVPINDHSPGSALRFDRG